LNLCNSVAWYSGSVRRSEDHAISENFLYTVFVASAPGCAVYTGSNYAAYACQLYNGTSHSASNCLVNTRYCCCGDCESDAHEWTGNCTCSGPTYTNGCSVFYGKKRSEEEAQAHGFQNKPSHENAWGYKCATATYSGLYLNTASSCVAQYETQTHHATYEDRCGKRSEDSSDEDDMMLQCP